MPLGRVSRGQAVAGVEDELGDVDLHGADIDAALAHGAHPGPLAAQNLLVQPQGGHPQEFARIHVIKARGRAARRTGAAGQTQVQVPPFGEQRLDLVLEDALLFPADLDCFLQT